jgi:exopolysaccharide biosynthesis protein
MIKRVSKFQTSDGKLFDVEAEAKSHESKATAFQELSALLVVSMQTNRVDAVVRHIIEDDIEVRSILSRYHKRQPRMENVTPLMALKVA